MSNEKKVKGKKITAEKGNLQIAQKIKNQWLETQMSKIEEDFEES